MTVEVLFWPAADDTMKRLEGEPESPTLAGIRRTLGRLELDPFDPKLRTRQFTTDQYGHVRATPALDEWFVLWQVGAEEGTIEVVLLAELHL